MEKAERSERQIEEKRMEWSETISKRFTEIWESLKEPVENIQASLEHMQDVMNRLAPIIKRAAIQLQERIDEAELEYNEVAEFYKDWKGKKPPRFKRYLDWFFEVKLTDENRGDSLAFAIDIKEEDLEHAGLWLLNKIEFEIVKTKLQKLGLLDEQIKSLEVVVNSAKEHPTQVASPEKAREYVGVLTSQIDRYFPSVQSIVLENIKRYYKMLPGDQAALTSSIWIRDAIDEYITRLWQLAKEMEERKAIAWKLNQEIEIKWPSANLFADRLSFEQVHFPKLEVLFKDWQRKRKDAFSEEQFQTELKVKLEELEAEIKAKFELWKPDQAKQFRGAIGLPKDWEKEQQQERRDYLYALLTNKLAIDFLSSQFPVSSDSQEQMDPFIVEIVDREFAKVVKNWPSAKEKAEGLKTQMAKDLGNFMKDSNKFGQKDTLEELEKGLAYTKKQIKEFTYDRPEGEFYSTKLAEYEAMFAFYQHMKTVVFANEPKPAPRVLGSELVEVVRKALEAKKLLTPAGQFAGKGKVQWKVRALYDALNDRTRNYIPDIIHKENAFSDFFHIHFGFYVSGTSLRTSPNKYENIEKEKKLKLDFLAIIPEK
ncbi:MAG: hypothetical protein HRU41_11735 [Saprospiraceae bacterium]|nr:hypothetical protein [Saprospiraceae bacterium]